jgi:hypothetical protein
MEGFTTIAPGMALVEAGLIERLIKQNQDLQIAVLEAIADLKNTKKTWYTAQEVMELTGFGKSWLNDNKKLIGFAMVGGCLRFKRQDVEDFIEANYFKVKSKKRY